MTYLNDRARPYVEPLAQAVDAQLFMPLEVREPAQADAMFESLKAKWGRLDILVHSIAFAPQNALEGRVIDSPKEPPRRFGWAETSSPCLASPRIPSRDVSWFG